MSGIQSNLKTIDLGAAFKKLSESVHRETMIAQFRDEFMAQSIAPWLADQLAKEKYNNLQKTQQ